MIKKIIIVSLFLCTILLGSCTETKKDFDMSGITVSGLEQIYDGNAKNITVNGELPNGVVYQVLYNNLLIQPKEIGEYSYTVEFFHEVEGYNEIPDMTGTMKILDPSDGGSEYVSALAKITAAKTAVAFANSTNIVADFNLPLASNSVSISWNSSDNGTINVVDQDLNNSLAFVTRPAAGAGNKTVTLTATFKVTYTENAIEKELTDTKTYSFIVIEKGDVTTPEETYTFEFENDATSDASQKFSVDKLNEYFKEYGQVTSVNDRVYPGKDSTIKMSSSSSNGEFSFKLADGKKAATVIVNASFWKATETSSLTINGVTQELTQELSDVVFNLNEEANEFSFSAEKRVYIKSITVTTGSGSAFEKTDEEKVAAAISTINGLNLRGQSGNKLPLLGATNGALVTWSLKSGETVDFDVVDKTLPTVSENTTFTLVATVKSGDVTQTVEKVVTVTVKEVVEKNSLSEAKEAAYAAIGDDKDLTYATTFDAVVAGKTSASVVFANGGAYIYAEMSCSFNIGDQVTVSGNIISSFSNIKLASDATVTANPNGTATEVESIATTIENVQSLTHENGGLSGKLITVSGKLEARTVGEYTNYYIVDGANEILIYHRTYGTPEKAIYESFVGKYVEVKGYLEGYHTLNKCFQMGAYEFVEFELTDDEKVDSAISNLNGLNIKGLTGSKLSLITSYNGTTITWALKPGQTVDFNISDLILPTVEENMSFTLIATVKAGDVVKTIEKEVTVITSNISGYYASTVGLTGEALLNELNKIANVGSTGNYDDLKRDLPKADADPNHPGNMILFYSQASVKGSWDSGNTWNREHMWPQSKGGNATEGDLHNMRPTDPRINSTRGNLPYGETSGQNAVLYGGKDTGCKVGGGYFNPADDIKGDTARSILYILVRYPNMRSGISQIGNVNTFIDWCMEDLPDEAELARNDRIQDIQGNRNPFVDNAAFAELIGNIYN